MNKFVAVVLSLPITLMLSASVQAQSPVDVDDVTMDVIDNVRDFRREGRADFRRVVAEFMLANGDISQAELDAMATQRQAVRAELAALRDSGDNEALRARLSELREQRQARRDEIRSYIDQHEALQDILQARRETFRERRANQ